LRPRPLGERRMAMEDNKIFSWRKKFRPASFKGALFYVEQQGRSSGRRTVLHQYPKRDIPYAEDMGREAIHYAMTGYLIQAPLNPFRGDINFHNMHRDYDVNRDALESKLMEKSPGRLLDPYNPTLTLSGYGVGFPLLFMCEKYTITEARERGGYCTVEMSFVEAGMPGNNISTNAPPPMTVLNSSVMGAQKAAADSLNNSQAQQPRSLQQQIQDMQRRLIESGIPQF
jgi:hypothetical protein